MRYRDCWHYALDLMKTKVFFCIVVGVIILFSFPFLYETNNPTVASVGKETTTIEWTTSGQGVATTRSTPAHDQARVTVICVVVCGSEKFEETLAMIKSALVFAKKPLEFIIFAEYRLIPDLHETLDEWKQTSNKTFKFAIRPVTYPSNFQENEWKGLFKPCASQRLFLPDVLESTDAVLYVDTDTLFLGQPAKIWRVFDSMSERQLVALTKQCEDENTCWYPKMARHPYVQPLGVNSGVMFMNLTRMREVKWSAHIVPILKEFKNAMIWGEQDVINIYFYLHPESLLIIDCRYNYRPDHCMYDQSTCRAAEQRNGAIILHGSRGVFHNKKQPPFRAVYYAISQYRFKQDTYKNLLLPLKSYLTQENSSSCFKAWPLFMVRPELNLGLSVFTEDYHLYDPDL